LPKYPGAVSCSRLRCVRRASGSDASFPATRRRRAATAGAQRRPLIGMPDRHDIYLTNALNSMRIKSFSSCSSVSSPRNGVMWYGSCPWRGSVMKRFSAHVQAYVAWRSVDATRKDRRSEDLPNAPLQGFMNHCEYLVTSYLALRRDLQCHHQFNIRSTSIVQLPSIRGPSFTAMAVDGGSAHRARQHVLVLAETKTWSTKSKETQHLPT
jgi:hypothetical protein